MNCYNNASSTYELIQTSAFTYNMVSARSVNAIATGMAAFPGERDQKETITWHLLCAKHFKNIKEMVFLPICTTSQSAITCFSYSSAVLCPWIAMLCQPCLTPRSSLPKHRVPVHGQLWQEKWSGIGCNGLARCSINSLVIFMSLVHTRVQLIVSLQ